MRLTDVDGEYFTPKRVGSAAAATEQVIKVGQN